MDDEPDFLRLVTENLGPLSAGVWQIHHAVSADEALQLLKRQKMDLAVVDINMPMLDGVQFLRILGRRYPDLKKITLTALATEEKRTECLASGAELFIEKPHNADGFKSIFVMLDELLTWAPKEGFQGMLRHVGLQDVIQMECLGRNSSILEVHNPQVRGRLYIENGNLTHAVLGEDAGELAFQKLLSLPSGQFQLLPFEPPDTKSISGAWEFLLMEASRVRDEIAAQTPTEEGSADAVTEAPVSPSIAIAETLICSARGEPLYSWQCANLLDRVALLQNIAQQTTLLSQTLPLGKFERLEILQPDRRAVALFGPDRLVFVRTVKTSAAA